MKYMLSLVPQQSDFKLLKRWTPRLAFFWLSKDVSPTFDSYTAIVASTIGRTDLYSTALNINLCYVNSRYSVYLKVIKERFPTKSEIIRIVENRLRALQAQMKTMWPSYPLPRREIADCNGRTTET